MSHHNVRPPFGRVDTFQSRLAYCSFAERHVARWGLQRGYSLQLLCLLSPCPAGSGPLIDTRVGPRIVAEVGVPLAGERCGFFQAMRQRIQTLHRKTDVLLTGMDAWDLRRYLDLANATNAPVVLAIMRYPEMRELLGGDVIALAQRQHHAAAGVSFWRLDDLDVFASLLEMAEMRLEIARQAGVRL